MPNLPPLPLIDGCLFIDNSFLELLSTCPRQLQYSQLNRRISADTNYAQSFGTAGHLVWEHRYKTYGTRPPDEKLESEQLEILTDHFAQNPTPEDERRDLNFAIDLFVKRYNKRYIVEPFQLLLDGEGKPMVELPFALPLFEAKHHGIYSPLQVYYSGRIDLPVRWNDLTILIDHKTSSILGPYYFKGEAVSPQYLGYCWSFEQLTGQKIDAFCINGIRTSEKPEYVLKWERSKKSLLDDFEEQQEPSQTTNGDKKKGDPKLWWQDAHQRRTVYLKPGQLDEWQHNTITKVEELLWHYQRDYMPTKEKWCVGKYGECQYYEVCHGLPTEQKMMVLNSGAFKDNDWSPLRKPTKIQNV
jgi:hypothetical protein